ncbi:hypothetical protein ACFQJC_01380 [Haloferax namakaokahaiae]|uniref:Uncharacterized protein n=1 Tax=Haloferax namakaokahaiae TaxID=1748331 RepID=A0ABD5ZAG0_9EURY
MSEKEISWTRRSLLSVVGTGVLAGCSGQSSESTPASTTRATTETPPTAESTTTVTPEPTAEPTTTETDTPEPTPEDPAYDVPTLELVEPPEDFQPMFDKSMVVFGVRLVGTERVSEAKLRHAGAVMAEYLDNDEDGVPDNPAVVDELVAQEATLIVPYDERELEEAFDFLSTRLPPSRAESVQDLHAVEIHPEGLPHSTSGDRFDATLEEVLHLVTHVGFSSVYPDVFGEQSGSEIADAMDIARGGHFEDVPNSYPDEAWYTYDDDTCDYGCQITEYTYWAGTSAMGAQAVGSRPAEIDHEWRLATSEAVETQDTAVFEILSNPEYGFPLELPDGSYAPAEA